MPWNRSLGYLCFCLSFVLKCNASYADNWTGNLYWNSYLKKSSHVQNRHCFCTETHNERRSLFSDINKLINLITSSLVNEGLLKEGIFSLLFETELRFLKEGDLLFFKPPSIYQLTLHTISIALNHRSKVITKTPAKF